MRVEKLRILSLFLGLGFIVISCSIDDGKSDVSFTYKLNSITSVKMPDTLLAEEMYNFRVEFENPADCYEFAGFHLEIGENPNERVISAISTVINERTNCSIYRSPRMDSKAMEFLVKREDYYVLKFWQGTDSEDQPIYLKKRIEIKK